MGNLPELFCSALVLDSAYYVAFIYCYFGNKVTSAFEGIHKCIYLCDWKNFPLDMQKYIPMKMMIAKQNVYMRTFSQVHCTFQTFGQVIVEFLKPFSRYNFVPMLILSIQIIISSFKYSTALKEFF